MDFLLSSQIRVSSSLTACLRRFCWESFGLLGTEELESKCRCWTASPGRLSGPDPLL